MLHMPLAKPPKKPPPPPGKKPGPPAPGPQPGPPGPGPQPGPPGPPGPIFSFLPPLHRPAWQEFLPATTQKKALNPRSSSGNIVWIFLDNIVYQSVSLL